MYTAVRSGLPPLGKSSRTNQWVFASKLCARKRPLLFPVRDAKVCTYLSDGKSMGDKPGRLGRLRRDIPVFAHLIARPEVRSLLEQVHADFKERQPTWAIDDPGLRLLDVVLWMQTA